MKFVFTGPESCGKTTLCTWLSAEVQLPMVQEVARLYLDARHNVYHKDDLYEMALLQAWEEQVVSSSMQPTCCDTDVLTIIIWAMYKYSTVDEHIVSMWKNSSDRHYFLCAPDIPWVFDPQRENSNDRDQIFELYHKWLSENNQSFTILSGSMEEKKALILQKVTNINKNLIH